LARFSRYAPLNDLFGAIRSLPRAKPRRVAFFTRFYVASPFSLPAQTAQSLLAVASGGRMLPARENFRSSELAPVMKQLRDDMRFSSSAA
jgi:hypothetical protein